MAKRFRYYLRQGWHTVNVDRANVWNWNINGKDVGNEEHFKERDDAAVRAGNVAVERAYLNYQMLLELAR